VLKIADVDDDVIVATATVSALTAANVVGQMQIIYNAIPATVISSENLKFYVSTNVFKLYQQAIANASSEAYYVGAKEPNFLGIPLLLAPGLPAERIVAADSQNLTLVTDLLSDEEQLSIIPQFDKTGVRTVRIVGNFKFGVNYLVSEEVVTYNTL